MFPGVAFDEDLGWGEVWRSVFAEWLGRAGEVPLWRDNTGESYRFLSSSGGPGLLLRVEADTREAVAKRFEMATDGWAVREYRRALTGRELVQLRWLIEAAGFWAMQSPNPLSNVGLDGAKYLFEARAAGYYHLVLRWSPRRGEFANLCRFCESLTESVVNPRRAWWRI